MPSDRDVIDEDDSGITLLFGEIPSGDVLGPIIFEIPVLYESAPRTRENVADKEMVRHPRCWIKESVGGESPPSTGGGMARDIAHAEYGTIILSGLFVGAVGCAAGKSVGGCVAGIAVGVVIGVGLEHWLTETESGRRFYDKWGVSHCILVPR